MSEVGKVERRVGEGFVGDHRPQIGEPVILGELPFLNMVRQRDHVEARVAGIEFDDRLLPLLLLGNHFRSDNDAGQVLELLVKFGQQIATGTLDQKDFDLLAFEAFPVERTRTLSLDERSGGQGA